MTTADSATSLAGSWPDEVVTEARVRYLDVPGVPAPVALITLDNGRDHTRPATFGPGGLAALDAAVDEIEAHSPGVAAIGVTGTPFIFSAGADLDGAARVTGREQARDVARFGHRVFRRFRESTVPTFAFVNGVALGGGLELALACHYRTLSSGAGALAFPECFLGIVPGWGGCWLLPNLIGADGAVRVIVDNALANNRMLKPAQALELGIADTVFDPADFLERSLEWAAGILRGDHHVDRRAVDRGPGWDDAVRRGRAGADAKLHGAAPAPYRALDLIAAARASTLDEGFAAEDEALTDLIMSEEFRAGAYAFDLVQRRARRPVGAPDRALARPVTKVGIVGAGLMACQLALLFVRRLRVPVVLTDVDAARVEAGVAAVHSEIEKLQALGRVGADEAARLTALVSGSPDLRPSFTDADLVIEAVFEDLEVKQKVFADVEGVVSPTCLLATNTSSLSVTRMGAGIAHPERLVGLHFFNPVAVLPLVEVVRTPATDDASLATALAVGREVKKSCVLVADAPAFVVNRLLTRFLGEVIASVDEGTPIEVADGALSPLGLPMTPFVLLALVGPAVALHVAETLHTAFPDRFAVSDNLARVVAAGKNGIYLWADGVPTVDPEVAALIEQGGDPSTVEQLRARSLDALAEEIGLMLDEGVVAAPADIDLCLILGAGWPFHLGGITPYLDRTGVSERVRGRRFQQSGGASVPA
ncbi:MAG TPA: 3-hydroxyacyl-CoA dehydrogenase NAD-binding domain-containing protein [Mycobacteriales bacterium]